MYYSVRFSLSESRSIRVHDLFPCKHLLLNENPSIIITIQDSQIFGLSVHCPFTSKAAVQVQRFMNTKALQILYSCVLGL